MEKEQASIIRITADITLRHKASADIATLANYLASGTFLPLDTRIGTVLDAEDVYALADEYREADGDAEAADALIAQTGDLIGTTIIGTVVQADPIMTEDVTA